MAERPLREPDSEPPADAGASEAARCPWVRREGLFQVVTGYEEATGLLTDRRLRADMAALFEGAGYTEGPIWEAAKASLLSMDGEEHRRFRAVVSSRFTPRAVEEVRPATRATAGECVEAILEESVCDVVVDFAAPYVTRSLCEFMGFTREEMAPVAWAVDRLAYATKDLAARSEALAEALSLADQARIALERRRAEPRGDVLGAIVEAMDRGEIPEEVGSVLTSSILSAGHEPTTNQIAIMVAVLAGHPHLWDAAGTGELPVATLLEELLRYRSTNVAVMRRAADDLDLGVLELRAREQFVISIAEANRDPRRFPEPDRLDPEANHGPHLAYGYGAHYCLGAALSRLHMQEALAALTSRLECPEIVELVEGEGAGLRAPAKLTVTVRARPG